MRAPPERALQARSCTDARASLPPCRFFAALLTAVLTYHLAWVPTVMPVDHPPVKAFSEKRTSPSVNTLAKTHPYNPLWAQLGSYLTRAQKLGGSDRPEAPEGFTAPCRWQEGRGCLAESVHLPPLCSALRVWGQVMPSTTAESPWEPFFGVWGGCGEGREGAGWDVLCFLFRGGGNG